MDYPDRITLAPPNISWWQALPLPEVRSISFPRGEFEVDTLGKVAVLLERIYVCTRSVVTADRIVLHVHRLRPAKLSETDVELPVPVRERHAQLGRRLNLKPVWRKHPSGGWAENSVRVSRTSAICASAVATEQSCVLGRAHMFDQAMLTGVAKLYDDASISGQAVVSDRAVVSGRACVADLATVSDEARVVAHADVRAQAEISGRAQILEQARVCGSAKVSGGACVCENAIVEGTASLSGSAYVGGIHVLWGGRFCEPPFYLMGPAGPLFQGDENTLAFYRSYRTDLSPGGLVKMPLDDAEKARAILFNAPLGHWDDSMRYLYWQYVQIAYQLLGHASPTSLHQSTYRRRLLH